MGAIPTFVSWLTAQRTGTRCGEFCGGLEEYGPGCCGPTSHLHQAVREAMKDAGERERDRLFVAISAGDSWLATVGRRCGDFLLARRLDALAETVRAHLARTSFETAADRFEGAWAGDRPAVPESHDPPPDDPLVKQYGPRLPLKRLGGWMVYDVLSHFSGAPDAAPVREETAVLVVADGAGAVRKLVVEWLPGPRGLVTPDWWPMGLVRFPQTDERATSDADRCRDTGFVESTQRVLAAVAARLDAGRLRWRLESYRRTDSLGATPISGRSAEAAATCAGLAVRERQGQPGVEVLDPNVCITAVVDGNDPEVTRRALSPVNIDTVEEKLKAAAAAGIPEVLVAAGQDPQPLPKPLVRGEHGLELRTVPVSTVGDAYLEMCATNKYVRAYLDHVRAEFFGDPRDPQKPGKWVEVETPQEGKRS